MSDRLEIEVSDVVANKAHQVGAQSWLDGLNDLVDAVLEDWNLTLGRQLHGGTEAIVAHVVRADGTPAVLKLMIPRRAAEGLGGRAAELEASVLRLVGGEGCAELLDFDLARGALLMERLGPSLFDLGIPIAEQHRIMVACAAAMWRPAPELELTTGATKARWLIDYVVDLWEQLDRPCPERTIAHAVTCGERRLAAHDDERAVLVHGDIHQWNTLRTLDGSGWKLVDPDGMLAEAEYDLGIIMREDPVPLMAGDPFDRSVWLADQTGLDAEAIWEWGVIERVSTGLLCTSIGLQPIGEQMLTAASQISVTSG